MQDHETEDEGPEAALSLEELAEHELAEDDRSDEDGEAETARHQREARLAEPQQAGEWRAASERSSDSAEPAPWPWSTQRRRDTNAATAAFLDLGSRIEKLRAVVEEQGRKIKLLEEATGLRAQPLSGGPGSPAKAIGARIFVTISDAARSLGVHRRTLIRWRAEGKLSEQELWTLPSGHWVMSRETLEDLATRPRDRRRQPASGGRRHGAGAAKSGAKRRQGKGDQ